MHRPLCAKHKWLEFLSALYIWKTILVLKLKNIKNGNMQFKWAQAR